MLVEDLCLKVEGLWEEVSRLHSIRDGKKKIGQIWHKLEAFGTKKKAPAPPGNLQLRNRFRTLIKEEGLGE